MDDAIRPVAPSMSEVPVHDRQPRVDERVKDKLKRKKKEPVQQSEIDSDDDNHESGVDVYV